MVEGQNLCIFYLSPFQLYSVPTVIYLFSLYRAKCQKIFEHEKFPLCELNIALGSQYVQGFTNPTFLGGGGVGGGGGAQNKCMTNISSAYWNFIAELQDLLFIFPTTVKLFREGVSVN